MISLLCENVTFLFLEHRLNTSRCWLVIPLGELEETESGPAALILCQYIIMCV